MTPEPKQLSEGEIVTALDSLGKRLRIQFQSADPSGTDDVYSGFIDDPGLDHYRLSIASRGLWKGLVLLGPRPLNSAGDGPVLDFFLISPNTGVGRTAATLAVDNGIINLYHSGKVYSHDNRGRPFSDETAYIGKTKYNFVTRFDSPYFFPDVVRFHRSRLKSTDSDGENSLAIYSSYDPGSNSEPYLRAAAWVSAIHHPIAEALKKEINRLGFSSDEQWDIRPDLVALKDKIRVLFEVKPNATSQDLMMGCGQLMIYNRRINADLAILVSPKPKICEIATLAMDFMAENRLLHVFVSKSEDNSYSFEGLENSLKEFL